MKTNSFFIMAMVIELMLVTSCGSAYHRPESIEDTMARYQAQNEIVNQVPEMMVYETDLPKNVRRGPASIEEDGDMNAEEKHSNKRLYFLTLFTQYNQLSRFSKNQAPEISICPSFHTTFMDHQEMNSKNEAGHVQGTWNYDPAMFEDKNYVSSYPELFLPISKESLHPTVMDMVKNEGKGSSAKWLESAMDTHIAKTYQELSELCESGASSNYYVFENLVTHINKKSNFGPTSENMKILMKTTLFSNMALLNSMERSLPKETTKAPTRGIASVKMNHDYYSHRVVERLGLDWASDYFANVKNHRK